MFFGLCNSPATFQGMMDDIFQSLILEGVVLVYIDDILIYGGQDIKEHRKIVQKVLDLLRKHHLYLKLEKCDFEKTKVEYLGMIIGENTVEMDPVKVQAVAEWPVPTCKRDIQVFLGFTNFYQRFIKDYAKMAKPLSKLTGKEEWEWTNNQQTGFKSLIKAFTHGPVLTMANDDGKFKTEIDASGFTCGGILMQLQNNFWRTIAFRSNTMNKTERNYGIEDREMLAIILALKDWQRYLLGAQEPFKIWTDHTNLQYFKDPHKVNRRQAQWFSDMADYHFTIHHLPGNKNCRADALSRRPNYNQGEDDNTNVILLPENLFRALLEEGSGDTLLNQIDKVQR